MTLQDLQDYNAITRTPMDITYRGNPISTTVGPLSGAVALSALKILEGYPRSLRVDGLGYDITIYGPIQAPKFGYGQRTNCGTPLIPSMSPRLNG